MEWYPRGSRGSPAKGVGRVTGAWVQIPPTPPTSRLNQQLGERVPLRECWHDEWVFTKERINLL